MLRSTALTLITALALAGCAAEGDKMTTGALKPIGHHDKAKPKRAKTDEASEPTDGKTLYCSSIRQSWKAGDMPPTPEALEKRRADNIYCAS